MAADDAFPAPLYVRGAHIAQITGLILGPLLAVAVYLLTGSDAGLSEQGRRVLALAALMATWWMTEALPLSATALLPVAVLPILKVSTVRHAAAPYADEIVFLFMGGFIIGEGIQRSGLHRRIALLTILGVGATPARMVGGVMLAAMLLSMWVSNTATTLMMLPIGISIVALVEARAGEGQGGQTGDEWTPAAIRNFAVAIVLGIAYAANIGGMATPVGTPPNLVMLRYARETLGHDIGFGKWMSIGLPLALVFTPLAWLMLTRVLHRVRAGEVPGGRRLIRDELAGLGRPRRAEWITLVVFLGAAGSWIFRNQINRIAGLYPDAPAPRTGLLTDAGIAVIAALALFLIPVSFRPWRGVVQWREAERLPWGILLLFGGGLSLADAMSRTGVDVYLGSLFTGLEGLALPLVVLALVAAVVLLGELASNTAVVTALMPVLAAAGPAMGVNPLVLMLAATLGSSCGFMLPVATPPNALAYATGRVRQPQMIRAGALLDLIGIVLVAAAVLIARW